MARSPVEPIPARVWPTLLAVAFGVLVVALDGAVVAVASPSIAGALRADAAGIQWVLTAQSLATVGLAIPAGTLADKFGRKKVFLCGVAGFALCSLACGFAGSIGFLIGARVVQGAFAAPIFPTALAIVRDAFPSSRLPTALGLFGSVTALAAAGGPLLGGVLVEYAGWHWVFLISLPFGVVGVLLGGFVIRESAEPGSKRLDLAGAVTATAAVAGLVWAITGAQEHGWTCAWTLRYLALSALALGGFLVIERVVAHPMVPPGLFRDRSFTAGLVLQALAQAALTGVVFGLMFYLQGVRALGGTAAAVALLPLTVTVVIAAPLAGVLTQKFGARTTLLLGAGAFAAAFASLLRLAPNSTMAELIPSLLLVAVGAGFLMVASMEAILRSTPVGNAGVVGGVKQAALELGGTVGVAATSALLVSVVNFRFPNAVRTAFGSGDPVGGRIADDPRVRQDVTLGFPPPARQHLSDQLGNVGARVPNPVDTVTDAAHHTFVAGLHVVCGAGLAIAVAAAALALLVRGRSSDSLAGQHDPEQIVATIGTLSSEGAVS
ncbi:MULTISPECIES: DHA2 family efflux MFS transporter permease subunit [unclassified Nocardia]|uniref:DHA2 family efflux MFS transporter permease subunit n=1 Tax=unclassified Nocardia TaxID=2637762 RepID=UPI001CE3EBA4|nr:MULTISPECIES: DHA2 family efflux MFS transporter permease subunit [unclassified Nocardia]